MIHLLLKLYKGVMLRFFYHISVEIVKNLKKPKHPIPFRGKINVKDYSKLIRDASEEGEGPHQAVDLFSILEEKHGRNTTYRVL